MKITEKNGDVNKTMIKTSRDFSNCNKCKRLTLTILKIEDGKKSCSCMHCGKEKGEPTGELILISS